jgi:hypothetical protein
VSISDIVITSYCRSSRVKKLRASSATSSTPGSFATPENSAIAPRCSPTILLLSSTPTTGVCPACAATSTSRPPPTPITAAGPRGRSRCANEETSHSRYL